MATGARREQSSLKCKAAAEVGRGNNNEYNGTNLLIFIGIICCVSVCIYILDT